MLSLLDETHKIGLLPVPIVCVCVCVWGGGVMLY